MGKGERGGVVREGDGEEVGPIWREAEKWGGGEDRGMGKGERGGVVREGDGEEVGPIWREGEMAGREMEGRGGGDIL